MVLLFHQGWLRGGYVGVSVFFTLSGYLITSLALSSTSAPAGSTSAAFYARRVRRLLPASLACLAAIVVLAAFGLFDGVEHLRRDLCGRPGPGLQLGRPVERPDLRRARRRRRAAAARRVDHYWSLAIEEQFYWVWPLVLVVVLRRGRRAAGCASSPR